MFCCFCEGDLGQISTWLGSDLGCHIELSRIMAVLLDNGFEMADQY